MVAQPNWNQKQEAAAVEEEEDEEKIDDGHDGFGPFWPWLSLSLTFPTSLFSFFFSVKHGESWLCGGPYVPHF